MATTLPWASATLKCVVSFDSCPVNTAACTWLLGVAFSGSMEPRILRMYFGSSSAVSGTFTKSGSPRCSERSAKKWRIGFRHVVNGGGPELVSEHDRASGARPIVSRVEQAPQHRLETHHFEVAAIDHAGVDFARFAAEPLRREADGGKSAEFADGL